MKKPHAQRAWLRRPNASLTMRKNTPPAFGGVRYRHLKLSSVTDRHRAIVGN